MFTQTVIVGNLTKDISLSYLPNGTALGKTSIAYTDGFGDKKKSHFIDIIVWGKTSEVMNQYCRKGSKVLVSGVVVFEQWVANDGTNRSKHSLRVETMKMLDSRQDSSQGNGTYDYTPPPNPASNNHSPSHQDGANQQGAMDKKIPEIDIDQDSIPF